MTKAREMRERAASTVVPLHRDYYLADARLLEQIADTLRALDRHDDGVCGGVLPARNCDTGTDDPNQT